MSEESPTPSLSSEVPANINAPISPPIGSVVPRCIDCGYVLLGLPENRCPECGRTFDPYDPKTYATKPPFLRFRYWMPGLLLALGSGIFGYLGIVEWVGWGMSATLVLPFCAGAILGYGVRVRWIVLPLLWVMLAAGLFFGLISMQLVGVFCGLILAGLILGPLVLGMLTGVLLRRVLKGSDFSQRWHLPTLVFLLLPHAAAGIERFLWTPPPVESVRTSIVIPAPVDKAWRAMAFYEQVDGQHPFILRLPGMPRLQSVTGGIGNVGDRTVCVYDKGRLVKQVTASENQRLLAFRVVEQGFERHSIRLVGGSFRFDSIDDKHTRVTLETTYRPYMAPRWCWRPFEQWTVHTLHGHVLDGMRRGASPASFAGAESIDPAQTFGDDAGPNMIATGRGAP